MIDKIPIETLLGWVTTFVTLMFGGLSGAAALFALWFRRTQHHKEAETKIKLAKVESDLKDAEAKRDREHIEIQSRLDETHANRETLRLLFSELNESRREDGLIRASYERREMAQIEATREIVKAVQGIESNTASTLELLKTHQEMDDTMSIKQEKVIAQNDTTHQRIAELSSDVSAIAIKLDNLSTGLISDRRAIGDIQEGLKKIQEGIALLEKDTPKAENATSATPQAPISQDGMDKEPPA